VITAFQLSEPLRAKLCNEARAAFPRECCGLIEGTLHESVARVSELHPTQNLATRTDRFEIDPARHIALLRQLRAADRSIIGCYHSHSNGRPEPSELDRDSAAESNFVWLIVALENSAVAPRIAAFVSTGFAFGPLRIETD
jgi:proteasome lid subunit RPN8/RPN11